MSDGGDAAKHMRELAAQVDEPASAARLIAKAEKIEKTNPEKSDLGASSSLGDPTNIYPNRSKGSPMSNNRDPEKKLPGEKPEGKFHYNPGNMSGKKIGEDKKTSENTAEPPAGNKD